MKYPFKIIAIGSSAGGLAPLQEILGQLPAHLKAAIVIVTHIGRDSETHLDKIIGRVHDMPVYKIENGMHIQPHNTYVIPGGQVLLLKNGLFQLIQRQANEKVNKAIDQFFTSLAAEAGAQSIGIILSGAGYDGIEGAKAIEDKAGVIIVQEPYTAQFPLMPQSLIAFDHPDYVLTPTQIARKIIELCA